METQPQPEKSAVLGSSLLAAAEELGVSKADIIGVIIGRDRNTIQRRPTPLSGIA